MNILFRHLRKSMSYYQYLLTLFNTNVNLYPVDFVKDVVYKYGSLQETKRYNCTKKYCNKNKIICDMKISNNGIENPYCKKCWENFLINPNLYTKKDLPAFLKDKHIPTKKNFLK